MPTVNENHFNATIRHQVQIQRFIAGQVEEFLEIIRQSDPQISQILFEQLPVRLRSRAYNQLLNSIVSIREEAFTTFRGQFDATLREFADQQIEFEAELLNEVVPVDTDIGTPIIANPDLFRRPFQFGQNASATVESLFQSILDSDRRRIESAIQLGLEQGESVPDIVARLIGTRDNNFADGVYATTRRHAETLVRTVINDVTNYVREEFYAANDDIIVASIWRSTLDGRTSAICRFRDGRYSPVGNNPLPPGFPRLEPPSARPPAHPNCRSVKIALISLDGLIGERPFVAGERLNFRRLARERAGSRWGSLSQQERDRLTALARENWLRDNVGTVSATTTYGEWLSQQSIAFQDDVLGPTRGQLLRSGALRMEQFHDTVGNFLTLEQLRSRHPNLSI